MVAPMTRKSDGRGRWDAISLFLLCDPSSVHGKAMTETEDLTLTTKRLLLRPFRPEDAGALQTQCSNLNVARMTSRIPHPYPDGAAESWIAEQASLRRDDKEITFCVERAGAMIGAVALRHLRPGTYELGYWIGEPHWGQGFATEAARRTVAFAFDDLDAARVYAGHYVDNPASGHVLEKCGFRYTCSNTQWSVARGTTVVCRRYIIEAVTAQR